MRFGVGVCLELKSGSDYRGGLRPYDWMAKRQKLNQHLSKRQIPCFPPPGVIIKNQGKYRLYVRTGLGVGDVSTPRFDDPQ